MLSVLFVLFLFLFSLSFLSAHNWVGNAGRAQRASVVKPCPARQSPHPHIQASPDQLFQMEWSQGHGADNYKFAYFVALHESDYSQLLSKTFSSDVADYVRNAPPSGVLSGDRWERNHVMPKDSAYPMSEWWRFWAPPLTNSSERWIPRDNTMIARHKHPRANSNVYQLPYHANQTQDDKRADYYNPKYPWIENAHRFPVTITAAGFANQYDLANFKITGRKGSGNYIYYYFWGGYHDCVDINIYNGPVVNRYGLTPQGSDRFFKVDHCEFTLVPMPSSPCRIVPRITKDAAQCLKDCVDPKYPGCTTVQAVRVSNPAGTIPYSPNIPWSINFGPYPNCWSNLVHYRTTHGCNVTNWYGRRHCEYPVVNPQLDDYVCYGFVPAFDKNLEATENYVITNDPKDPRYYSTCWFPVKTAGFLNITIPPPIATNWRAGNQCVNCSVRTGGTMKNWTFIVDWPNAFEKPDRCRNCEQIDQF